MLKKFKKHEEKIDGLQLPERITYLLKDYNFYKLIRNYSTSCCVYRAIKKGYPTLYLKIGKNLYEEKIRLSWLEYKLTIPNIIEYLQTKSKEYLLLTEIPGLAGDDKKWLANFNCFVEVLVEQINKMHSLPVENCPFVSRLDTLLASAEYITRHELIDLRKLSEEYRHRTTAELFKELLQLQPSNEEIAFTHGDLCLPNILIQEKVSVGFIDWNRAGLSDPYRDIALLNRSICSNFGLRYSQIFLGSYSKEIDVQKIKFYTLLDQFSMELCKKNVEFKH